MNFGDILTEWEKRAPENRVYGKEEAPAKTGNAAGERRRRLLRKKPDAVIDLHELSADDAWTALSAFFESSRDRAFEKVLVIHGKGNHRNYAPPSPGKNGSKDPVVSGAVLKELSARFIRNCPWVSESGYCSAREGGSGATWVIFKEKDYRSR